MFTISLNVSVELFVTVKELKDVIPPTPPPKVTAPDDPACKVKLCAPSIVAVLPEKVIDAPAAVPPLFVESIFVVDAKVELPCTVIAPPDVVTVPPKELPKEPTPPPAVPLIVIAPVLVKLAPMKIPSLAPVGPPVPVKESKAVVAGVQFDVIEMP
jgi:hypothetical protein